MKFEKSNPILYTSDIKKSIDYYMNVLEFDNSWTWDEPPTFGGVVKDDVEIFFCQECQGNKGTWLCIVLDDVDEYYNRIKLKDAMIMAPPESMEWNMREMFVKDPDGHVIRFGHRIECD